jgi:serine/threonine protein phosphatase 1
MALSGRERDRLLDFMGAFLPYAETEAGGRHFVMVHAGIHDFAPDRPMSSYSMNDLILHRADYGRRYFPEPDRILVTGHTPTFTIRSDGQSLVYREQGHLAVDCGCVYGGCLCAVCLDSLQVWYQT